MLVTLQKILLALILVLLFLPQLVSAETLKVGTIERPPFMMSDNNGNLTWFSIELWEEVAQKLDLDYDFQVYTVFSDMISDTKIATNDLSIANISITSEREREMDFSNPIFDSGLALMVQESSLSQQSFLPYVLRGNIILIFLVLILGPFIVYHFMKKKKFKKYKYMFVFWYLVICSSVLSALYTHYNITSIQNWVYNIWTLSDKKVWAISGSTAESFLSEFIIPEESFETIDELYWALLSWDREVIVHDYPVLQYKSKQDDRLQVVGDTFKKEKYGVVYPQWSQLKESINIALLELKNEWIYDEIYSKYFWEY